MIMTGIIQKKIGILQTAIILRSQQSIPYITEPSTMFQECTITHELRPSLIAPRITMGTGRQTSFFSAHRLKN